MIAGVPAASPAPDAVAPFAATGTASVGVFDALLPLLQALSTAPFSAGPVPSAPDPPNPGPVASEPASPAVRTARKQGAAAPGFAAVAVAPVAPPLPQMLWVAPTVVVGPAAIVPPGDQSRGPSFAVEARAADPVPQAEPAPAAAATAAASPDAPPAKGPAPAPAMPAPSPSPTPRALSAAAEPSARAPTPSPAPPVSAALPNPATALRAYVVAPPVVVLADEAPSPPREGRDRPTAPLAAGVAPRGEANASEPTAPEAPAVAVSQVHAVANAEAVAQGIREHLSELRQAGHVELHLDLAPPQLGRVRVQLVARDEQVHVRLVAQDEGARHLLVAQADTLRQRLSSAGVAVGELDVGPGGGGTQPNRDQDDAPLPPARKTGAARPAASAGDTAAGRVDVMA